MSLRVHTKPLSIVASLLFHKRGMVSFTLAHPQYLFLLFAAPLLIFLHFFALSSKRKTALKFANFDAIARIQGVDFFSKNVVIVSLYVLMVVLLSFSLAGLTLHTTARSSAFTFVLGIDSSQSMQATDFVPDRITVAKRTASEFVSRAPIDVAMGVVSFAGSTKIEHDLTERKDELGQAISDVELSGYGGTDVYEVVLTATNMLSQATSKAIILLSDGQINVGNLDDAVEYANEHDVIVHAIGMGTLEGGETDVAFSKLDENSLKSLTYETGGVYVRAGDEDNVSQAFSTIYDLNERKVAIELHDYFLIASVVLLVLTFFLMNTRYVHLP